MPTTYDGRVKCVTCNVRPKDIRAHLRTKTHKANAAYQERHFGKSKIGPLRRTSKAGWNEHRPGKKRV